MRRQVDFTEVFRRRDSESWGALPLVTLDSGSTGYADVPGPGKWYYMIRFGAAQPAYEDSEACLSCLSRPRSTTSSAEPDTGLTIGAAAPTWLRCEGNFGPTMDCEWYVASQSAAIQVFRDGALRATLSAGTTTWVDTPVTYQTTYVYKIRHIEDGAPGLFSAPDTVVAEPVPPEILSCAGTGDTEVTCLWGNQETDTTEVWGRIEGGRPIWEYVGDAAPGANEIVHSPVQTGLTYWYKARYRRGSGYSAWSNEDDAHPGDPGDPLRPIRP